jgi:hypothetical protein
MFVEDRDFLFLEILEHDNPFPVVMILIREGEHGVSLS